MKFTTNLNKTFKSGLGSVPKPWIDYDLDEEKSIYKYLEKHIRVYDADICGDQEVVFYFENGRKFTLSYSWWLNYHDLGEYESPLKEEYFVEEDKKGHDKKPRDWLV